METFELVIFDCDGALVDSERLAVRIEAEIFTSLGWPVDEREAIARFVDHPDAVIKLVLEEHLGRSVDWVCDFLPRYRELFDREFTPVNGVEELLRSLATLTCPRTTCGRVSRPTCV